MSHVSPASFLMALHFSQSCHLACFFSRESRLIVSEKPLLRSFSHHLELFPVRPDIRFLENKNINACSRSYYCNTCFFDIASTLVRREKTTVFLRRNMDRPTRVLRFARLAFCFESRLLLSWKSIRTNQRSLPKSSAKPNFFHARFGFEVTRRTVRERKTCGVPLCCDERVLAHMEGFWILSLHTAEAMIIFQRFLSDIGRMDSNWRERLPYHLPWRLIVTL